MLAQTDEEEEDVEEVFYCSSDQVNLREYSRNLYKPSQHRKYYNNQSRNY